MATQMLRAFFGGCCGDFSGKVLGSLGFGVLSGFGFRLRELFKVQGAWQFGGLGGRRVLRVMGPWFLGFRAEFGLGSKVQGVVCS